MKKKIIIANWKCNPKTLPEAQGLFEALKHGLKEVENVEIVICPPFVYLSIIQNSSIQHLTPYIKVGSQDCFWEQAGAYTGEISPAMLKDLGCQYVVIGHSERRRYFGETDEMIAKKLKAALEVGLKPILCLGETLEQRKQGKVNEVLEKQLGIFKAKNLTSNIQDLTIAYEPVWAIGTGIPCSPKEAAKTHQFISDLLVSTYNLNPKAYRLIYGGSVDSKNIESFLKEAGIEGALVGGASLKAEEFIKIIKIANRRSE